MITRYISRPVTESPLYVFFGHHKCATTWINSIASAVCCDLGFKFSNVHHRGMFGDNLGGFVKQNRIQFLSYTNAEVECITGLNKFRGLHVIRDPRDIVVSAYFSHLYSHPLDEWPDLKDYRNTLLTMSRDDGLMHELERCEKDFARLYNWDYGQPHILEMRMEDIIVDPYESLVTAFVHLGLVDENAVAMELPANHRSPRVANALAKVIGGLAHKQKKKLPVEIMLKHIFHNRFSAQTKGRKRGVEDVKSHYRKGVSGDWRNYFTSRHCSYFKQKHNDLLIKLGYETGSEWGMSRSLKALPPKRQNTGSLSTAHTVQDMSG